LSKIERTPWLWWVAGADADVLRQCPRADQIFIQHLGLSLIGAFLFVFAITSISITIAFPVLQGPLLPLALVFSLLIASTVFMVDRLFIQADWDWQAEKQRRTLAGARWEAESVETRVHMALDWVASARWWLRRVGRFFVISFRILLSAAIGFTIASFLELVIYGDEIGPLMQRIHYEDNRAVYAEIDTRTADLDAEIAAARAERDRLAGLRSSLEAELSALLLQPPPVPSDTRIADIDTRIGAVEGRIAEEAAKSQRYAEDMIAERHGTVLRDGNTGVAGSGPRFATASSLKSLSDAAIGSLRMELQELEQAKATALRDREAEYAAAAGQVAVRRERLETEIAAVRTSLAAAQERFDALDAGRGAAIARFTTELQDNRADFVPFSAGVASQFRALRTLYAEYGSTFEKWMLKILIMLLELTPVLQKVFFSPSTLYAVKLDSRRRSEAYDHFDREVALRQQHLKRKADAAIDEHLDSQGIERMRNANVRNITEERGAA
jgi:hypothetical protein